MARADELMDEQYELNQLAKAHKAFVRSLATDQEWADHLDQVAPVEKLMLSLCFDPDSLTRTLNYETL